MTKFRINDNGKVIGHGKFSKKNIKETLKGAQITALAFGMGLSIVACKPQEITVTEAPKTIYVERDEIAPVAMYDFDQGNGQIHFTSIDHVDEYGYVAVDTFDHEVGWCEDKYQELMRLCDDPNAVVDDKINNLIDIHDRFMNQYDEYVDQGPSMQRDEFIRSRLDFYEEELSHWTREPYKHKIVPVEEIDRINDINERVSFDGPYYNIDNYKIPENTSLTKIVHSYADSKEQEREIIEQAIIDNNLTDPDKIYAGDTIKLTGVDKEDLTKLGYELNEADVIDQYMDYFKMVQEQGLGSISGDLQGMDARDDVNKDIETFMSEAHNPDSETDLIEYAKEICKKIKVNFGYDAPTLVASKGR